MSDQLVKKALETQLAAMTPAIDTVYENVAYSPVAGKVYQQVFMKRGQPENPVLGTFHVLVGFMQVNLYYPLNAGAGAAEARAELIKAQFWRGLSLTSGGVTVTINRETYIMSGYQDEDRWAVPVRVFYKANVN